MKLTVLLLVSLFMLASCSLVAKAEGLVDDARVLVAEAKAKIDEGKALVKDAAVAADTNKDGKTSGSEWATWLAGGGLVTLLGGIIKLFSLQKQTNELYDATHAPVAGPAAAQ